jgi:uncharacterized protein with HEPN domain
MRDDRERLLDMLEAIQKIEQFADDDVNCPIKNPLYWRVSLL